MMRVEMKIRMDKERIEKVHRAYHFKWEDYGRFKDLAHQVERAAEPVFFYRFPKEEERRLSPWKEIPHENYVLCLATLGKEVDVLADAGGREGSLLEAYMIECLSMEMLALLYEAGRREIEEKYGFVKEYDFFESGLEKFLKEFTKETGNLIKYREGYLLPQKSVIYAAVLSEKEAEDIEICRNCSKTDCVRRGAFH